MAVTDTDSTTPEAPRSGPFAGLVIADLTHALSGPFCTMLLAELGARVVKIERPGAGDVARGFPPLADGESVFFNAVNRGKESIALDVEAAADRELFLELVRRADVVAAQDPQTAARNMIVQAGRTRVLGNPIKMSTLPDPPQRPEAPGLDAHGAAIRRELAARGGRDDG